MPANNAPRTAARATSASPITGEAVDPAWSFRKALNCIKSSAEKTRTFSPAVHTHVSIPIGYAEPRNMVFPRMAAGVAGFCHDHTASHRTSGATELALRYQPIRSEAKDQRSGLGGIGRRAPDDAIQWRIAAVALHCGHGPIGSCETAARFL